MFRVLLFLFIAVPTVEFLILIHIGGMLGAFGTFTIIILTGIIGAHLAKRQGLKTVRDIRTALSRGHLPAAELVDGVIILIAGAVLLTPGFLTDILGFLLLLPGFRRIVVGLMRRRFSNSFGRARHRQRPAFSVRNTDYEAAASIIDVDAVDVSATADEGPDLESGR